MVFHQHPVASRQLHNGNHGKQLRVFRFLPQILPEPPSGHHRLTSYAKHMYESFPICIDSSEVSFIGKKEMYCGGSGSGDAGTDPGQQDSAVRRSPGRGPVPADCDSLPVSISIPVRMLFCRVRRDKAGRTSPVGRRIFSSPRDRVPVDSRLFGRIPNRSPVCGPGL